MREGGAEERGEHRVSIVKEREARGASKPGERWVRRGRGGGGEVLNSVRLGGGRSPKPEPLSAAEAGRPRGCIALYLGRLHRRYASRRVCFGAPPWPRAPQLQCTHLPALGSSSYSRLARPRDGSRGAHRPSANDGRPPAAPSAPCRFDSTGGPFCPLTGRFDLAFAVRPAREERSARVGAQRPCAAPPRLPVCTGERTSRSGHTVAGAHLGSGHTVARTSSRVHVRRRRGRRTSPVDLGIRRSHARPLIPSPAPIRLIGWHAPHGDGAPADLQDVKT